MSGMEQDLFSLADGMAARDKGMAVVTENESFLWRDCMAQIAEQYLRGKVVDDLFSGDDIRRFVGCRLADPHHPNVWSACIGACLRRWQKDGRIERFGMVQARSESRHASWQLQYRVVKT